MKLGLAIGRCAAALVLASVAGVAAVAEAPAKLPAEVNARIAEFDKECKANRRGSVEVFGDHILSGDFNADGKTDYVLFAGRMGCTQWNAVFGEADGSAIEGFVSQPDGKYAHDVLVLAQNLRVNASKTPAVIEVAKMNRDRWAYDTLTFAYQGGKWVRTLSRPGLPDEWPS